MLTIPGPSLRTCDGVSRRSLLQVGSLGLTGLTLPNLLWARDSSPANSNRHPAFGKAKSCLMIFLSGGASHHDTFDMKPNAPAEIRGEFSPIDSVVPGIQVCEHTPLIARQTDKYLTVRSLSHGDNNHAPAVYWMVTGHEYPKPRGQAAQVARDDHPHFGSSLIALDQRKDRPVPTFVTLPDYIAVAGPVRAGQHAGFLGNRFDPLVTRGDPNSLDYQLLDLGLVSPVTSDRLKKRRRLLDGVNLQLRHLEQASLGQSVDRYYQKAFSVIDAGVTQEAFDIHSEPEKVRQRYGRNMFGQSVLLGRRLVQAGIPLVQVNWIRIMEAGWDTHRDNFIDLKSKLLPPADRAFSALMEDMSASGLLDETLVILLGDFGRTPRINSNAGRDHWGPVNTILMAGAGLPSGKIYGATDKQGAYPTAGKFGPADLIATVLHALGVDHTQEVMTTLGRPYKVCEGQPVLELWG